MNVCPYSQGLQQCRPGTETAFMPWDIASECRIDFEKPGIPSTCDESQSGTRSGTDIRLAGSGDWFVSVAWGSSATSAGHVNTVSEPGTFLLVSLGLAGLLCSSLRRTGSNEARSPLRAGHGHPPPAAQSTASNACF